MKKISKVVNQITLAIKKVLKNKSKRLHDPLFVGNEKKYLSNCISSGYVSYVGKYVEVFERKISSYTKAKYTVATTSGTSALHLILRYFNLSSSDEVIVPSVTYVATANAVTYCGSTPNFVDIEKETFGICPKKLEVYLSKTSKKVGSYLYNKKTGRKIKALIAVHLYGFPCKIIEIKKICRKYNILLIEDAAEALGSFFKKKHLGTFSEAGVISFNGNKPITCGGGGVIITNNKKMSIKLKHLSTHAKKKDVLDHIHDDIGYNYRMNNLSAALGCAQLENVDKIITAKRKNFQSYFNIFKGYDHLKILKEPKFSRTNYWLITGILKNYKIKNKLLKNLKMQGYGLRTTWRPLHTLRIFKNCPRDEMQNSNEFFKKTINFPSSPILNYK